MGWVSRPEATCLRSELGSPQASPCWGVSAAGSGEDLQVLHGTGVHTRRHTLAHIPLPPHSLTHPRTHTHAITPSVCRGHSSALEMSSLGPTQPCSEHKDESIPRPLPHLPPSSCNPGRVPSTPRSTGRPVLFPPPLWAGPGGGDAARCCGRKGALSIFRWLYVTVPLSPSLVKYDYFAFSH